MDCARSRKKNSAWPRVPWRATSARYSVWRVTTTTRGTDVPAIASARVAAVGQVSGARGGEIGQERRQRVGREVDVLDLLDPCRELARRQGDERGWRERAVGCDPVLLNGKSLA